MKADHYTDHEFENRLAETLRNQRRILAAHDAKIVRQRANLETAISELWVRRVRIEERDQRCLQVKRLLELAREFHRSLCEEQRVRDNPVRRRYLEEYKNEMDAIEVHQKRIKTEGHHA